VFAIYLDENCMSDAFVESLRHKAVDVITCRDEGMRRRSDADQLERATALGRVLVTANVGHFCELHTEYLEQGRSHSGIVAIQQDQFSAGEKTRRLLRLMSAHPGEEMRNRLEFLSNW
jgi:hypothetical protein